MNELKLFNFKKKNVRIILKNKEPYFCLKDVCDVLEVRNPTRVKNRLDKAGVTTMKVAFEKNVSRLNFINEPNLYNVIFLSRKEEAKNFQRWVFKDVLPEIRKTGKYTKEEVDRIVSKEKRRELTDAIKESGLNEQMHGFAYKNFTELIYKLVFGMSSKKFKEAKGITGNLRDFLTPIQLTTIVKLENATKSFVDLGMKYHEIKVMLNNHLPDKIKEDCSKMIEI
jgi:prophage antirepressor-like protein